MPIESRNVLLVFNAGSATLKFSLHDLNEQPAAELGHGSMDLAERGATLLLNSTLGNQAFQASWPGTGQGLDDTSIHQLLGWVDSIAGLSISAVAHRIVHGGNRQQVAARVTPRLVTDLEALAPLAPLHQQSCLVAVRYIAAHRPHLPQIACFDTAFHHTIDPLERLFGLPTALSESGLRRYGYHGLSYEHIARALPRYDMRAAKGRTVVAHLGNGASVCALQNGRSVGTSMGFSTLDGVLMGTRPGRLDPGLILYLLRERGMALPALEDLLYHHCGLLGVSGGLASDMRTLMASESSKARVAIELFVRSVVKEIATMVAVLGGVDALVFTGGIGEHAAPVRRAILQGCEWLGLTLPPAAGSGGGNTAAARLTTAASPIAAWVIATDENATIARHSSALLGQAISK